MNLYLDTAATAQWQWDRAGDHHTQPHMIRLAAMLEDDNGDPMEVMSDIIQPLPNWLPIDPDLAAWHHVTDEIAMDSPTMIGSAIARFAGMAAQADTLVGHSVDFHRRLITRAFADLALPPPRLVSSPQSAFCTMREATRVVRIPGKGKGFKWPSLMEAATHFAPDGEPPQPPKMAHALGLWNVEQVRHIFHCLQPHAFPAKREEAS